MLSMPDLIAAMKAALIEFSTGGAQQPLRTVLEVGSQQSVLRRHAGRAERAGRGRDQAGHGFRDEP